MSFGIAVMRSLQELDDEGFYRIPEVREETLFDFIAITVVPKILRFAEILALAGFTEFAARRTNSWPIKVLAFLVLFCAFIHASWAMTELVKRLKFKRYWAMRAAFWILIPVGLAFIIAVLNAVHQFARTY